MSDTIRIERPLFSRRHSDQGGRVKLDSRGQVLVVRTRNTDSAKMPSLITLVDEHPLRSADADAT